MGRIFLGKPVHWLALFAALGALWAVGETRLHVTDFNLFTAAVAAATLGLLVVILLTTRDGEKVTRDDVPPPDDI
ncbi:MAG: hypothetical protein AAF192_03865 [Pseudomonadota bacterium]